MNLQSLIVVALRLMALNFLLTAAIQLTPAILSLSHAYKGATQQEFFTTTALPWVVLNGLFIGAILIWVFALPIAGFVTRRLPQEVSIGSLSLGDCYSVAFIGLGLYYVAGHLAVVLNWIDFFLKARSSSAGDSWTRDFNPYNVSAGIVPFIVGIILLVKGRSWAMCLAAKHQGVPVSPTESEAKD